MMEPVEFHHMTIFGLHLDDGAGTVSSYNKLIYFLKNISLKQFEGDRRYIDLSTLVLYRN